MSLRHLESYTDFTHGTVRWALTFNGEQAESLSEALDDVNGVALKQVASFVSLLNSTLAAHEFEAGKTEVDEVVKVELLDHTISLSIEVIVDRELPAPYDELLCHMAISEIAPKVLRSAIARFCNQRQDHILESQENSNLSDNPENSRETVPAR